MKMTIITLDSTNDNDVEFLEIIFSAIRREWNQLPVNLKEYIKTIEVEQKTLTYRPVITIKITVQESLLNGSVEWVKEFHLNIMKQDGDIYELTRRIFGEHVRKVLQEVAESFQGHTQKLIGALESAPKKVYPAIF